MHLATPIAAGRLLLRILAPEAAEGPYPRWMQDADVTQYLEVRFRDRDSLALATYIARMNESPDNLLLGLFLRPDRHVGNIKLGPIHPIHRRAAIGVVIGEKQEWGRGYATEAIAALTDHAFRTLGLNRVEAGFYASHASSMRAFEKAGFRVEARLAEYWRLDDGWDGHVWMARLSRDGEGDHRG